MPTHHTNDAAPRYPTGADLARIVGAAAGVEYVPFVDRGWAAGPAGSVDLIAQFGRATERPLRCLYAALLVSGEGCGVALACLVPLERAGEFAAYLDSVLVPLADGRVVVTYHGRTEEVRRQSKVHGPVELDGCHLFTAVTHAADHPLAVEHRELIGRTGLAGVVGGRGDR